jgi:hypothetical protein
MGREKSRAKKRFPARHFKRSGAGGFLRVSAAGTLAAGRILQREIGPVSEGKVHFFSCGHQREGRFFSGAKKSRNIYSTGQNFGDKMNFLHFVVKCIVDRRNY